MSGRRSVRRGEAESEGVRGREGCPPRLKAEGEVALAGNPSRCGRGAASASAGRRRSPRGRNGAGKRAGDRAVILVHVPVRLAGGTGDGVAFGSSGPGSWKPDGGGTHRRDAFQPRTWESDALHVGPVGQ